MKTDAVARRYGRALFGLAKTQGALDAVAASMAAIADAFADPGVMRVLTGPLTRDRKRQLLNEVADTTSAPAIVRHFLLLLAEHERLRHAPAIRDVFDHLLDAERGITRATVRTATALAPEMLEEITRAFGQITGKRVVAGVEIEPDLIAGIIVEVDGKVYDGSLRTELDRLQQRMATGS
jgi:F-type H+-transporting ATPase subunit delta